MSTGDLIAQVMWESNLSENEARKRLGIPEDSPATEPWFIIQTEHEPYNELSFSLHGKRLGILYFGPPMRFEGDAEESAKLFFEYVVRLHDVEMARLRSALEMTREDYQSGEWRHFVDPKNPDGALISERDWLDTPAAQAVKKALKL